MGHWVNVGGGGLLDPQVRQRGPTVLGATIGSAVPTLQAGAACLRAVRSLTSRVRCEQAWQRQEVDEHV